MNEDLPMPGDACVAKIGLAFLSGEIWTLKDHQTKMKRTTPTHPHKKQPAQKTNPAIATRQKELKISRNCRLSITEHVVKIGQTLCQWTRRFVSIEFLMKDTQERVQVGS